MITRSGLEAAFFLILIALIFMIVPPNRLLNWYFNEKAQIPTDISANASDTGLIDGALNWVMEHTFVPIWNAFFSNDGFRLLAAPVGLVALVGVLMNDFIHGFKGRDDADK